MFIWVQIEDLIKSREKDIGTGASEGSIWESMASRRYRNWVIIITKYFVIMVLGGL